MVPSQGWAGLELLFFGKDVAEGEGVFCFVHGIGRIGGIDLHQERLEKSWLWTMSAIGQERLILK